MRSEKCDMAAHVLDYEPHAALFVPDDDPLLFYRAIARRAHEWLTPGGWLYFEINAALSTETAALLVAEGYSDVGSVATWRGKTGSQRGEWVPGVGDTHDRNENESESILRSSPSGR